MNKKYYFWLVFVALLSVLIILLIMRPSVSDEILIITKQNGESREILIADLLNKDALSHDEIDLNWHENYIANRANSLLKVFSIEQILENSVFSKIRFYSFDGASVLVEQTHNRDTIIYLILEEENNKLSLRLIFPQDSFSQRWLKNIVRIELE